MSPLDKLLTTLPNWISFADGTSDAVPCDVPNREYPRWLGTANGGCGFSGALRFFPAREHESLPGLCDWNRSRWLDAYGSLRPGLFLFAEDAFGLQFGFLEDGNVAIFWGETAEVEPLGTDLRGFVDRIKEDPDTTISFSLFQEAVEMLGPLSLNQHFAFKVETALGGNLSVTNLTIMGAVDHMRSLGKIATQITS
jgi:hypothetical protein